MITAEHTHHTELVLIANIMKGILMGRKRTLHKFPGGCLVATPAAITRMADASVTPESLFDRHFAGDWGNLSEHDKAENEFSLKNGFRIMSVYTTTIGDLWVITEADRSVTTILLPSDY